MIFEKQILNAYKGIAFKRCDGDGTAFYFSAKDFKGLNCEEYSFTSSLGHKLQGYLYSYENPIENRLVIFEHGFGGGHASYLREIEMLCKRGYLVFAYDHTGCMASGGENPNGMSQSLRDLNDCLNTLKSDARFSDFDISVIGHSWGGFSTLNITALHPDISHIVAISGFVSVERLIGSMFSGVLSIYRKAILEYEKKANPDFVFYNAVETLRASTTKALLIYSDNDPVCTKSAQYDALYEGLSGRENITLVLENAKGHNPNYSADAVKILGDYSAKRNKLVKKGLLKTEEQKAKFISEFDWLAMTEQDERVWDAIFKHFDS